MQNKKGHPLFSMLVFVLVTLAPLVVLEQGLGSTPVAAATVTQPTPPPETEAPSRSTGLGLIAATVCLCMITPLSLAASLALKRRFEKMSPER